MRRVSGARFSAGSARGLGVRRAEYVVEHRRAPYAPEMARQKSPLASALFSAEAPNSQRPVKMAWLGNKMRATWALMVLAGAVG